MIDESGKFLGHMYVLEPVSLPPGVKMPVLPLTVIGPAVANIYALRSLEKSMPSPEEVASVSPEVKASGGPYDVAFEAVERLKMEQVASGLRTLELGPEDAFPPGVMATLENWFSYHPPKDAAQIKQYADVRAAGLAFAKVICVNAPDSADRSAAIRLVREAVFTTNAAIACGGK